MAVSQQSFLRIRRELEEFSKERNVHVDDGFYVGLVNYSRNIGIVDIEDQDIERILLTLGKMSIELVATNHVEPRRVNGNVLLGILKKLCGDAYGNCRRASEIILGREIELEVFGIQLQPSDVTIDVEQEDASTAIFQRYLEK